MKYQKTGQPYSCQNYEFTPPSLRCLMVYRSFDRFIFLCGVVRKTKLLPKGMGNEKGFGIGRGM